MVWQAIELSTVLMRPAASGDWAEELYQRASLHRARRTDAGRTQGAAWAADEQLWDSEGWTIVEQVDK